MALRKETGWGDALCRKAITQRKRRFIESKSGTLRVEKWVGGFYIKCGEVVQKRGSN